MKKVLLLGGAEQQIVAINTAKRLGLFTILCDLLGVYEVHELLHMHLTQQLQLQHTLLKRWAYRRIPTNPWRYYVIKTCFESI